MKPCVQMVRFVPHALVLAILSVNAQASGSSCVAGQYDSAGGSNCVAASLGFYVPSAGATSQTPAPAGTYVDQTGQSTYKQCTVGTYNDLSGQSQCKDAPIGSYSDVAGLVNAKVCADGFYTDLTGQTMCLPTAFGKYSFGDGIMKDCPAGTYTDHTQTAVCTPAPVGKFVGNPGSTAASLCSAGTYADLTGLAACKPAPVGSYVDITGQIAPTPCPAGRYTSITGRTSCNLAPMGSYSNGDGLLKVCGLGTFSSVMESATCTPAPAGSYVSTTGATGASLCPMGSYQSATGQAACLPAPLGSYVDIPGALQATQCPVGTFSRTTSSTTCSVATYGIISFDQPSYSVDESATSVAVTVTRTNGSDDQESFDYYLRDASAVAGVNYVYDAGHKTLLNGQTSTSISVAPLVDGVYASDKDLELVLTNFQGHAQVGDATTVIHIRNTDAAPAAGAIGFSADSASASESSNRLTLHLTCSGGSAGTVSVIYTTQDATAVAGVDYQSMNGVLTFAPGELTKDLDILLINNTSYEGPRNFSLQLSNPQGGAVLGVAKVAITITDDEAAPAAGVFSFESPKYFVSERDGSLNIVVKRTGGSTGASSVELDMDANAHFAALQQTVNFADGDTQKTVAIPVLDSRTYIGDQTYTLSLSHAQNSVLARATSSTQVTVLDSDAPSATGVFSFSGANYFVNEGAQLNVQLTRAKGSTGAADLTVTARDLNAVNGTDYQFNQTQIHFADGEFIKSVPVNTIQDSLFHAKRQFALDLTDAASGLLLGNQKQTVVSIQDLSSPPAGGTLQLSGATRSVNETDGAVTFTVSRTGGSYGTATVDYALTAGTATAGSDYQATSGTLYFADGDTSKTFTVNILDDAIVESTETFSVDLSNAQGAVLGDIKSTQVSILDDDKAETPTTGKKSGGSFSWQFILLLLTAGFFTKRVGQNRSKD